MKTIKALLFLILLTSSLYASMQKGVYYVETQNTETLNLKSEFFNPHTKFYTIILATIDLKTSDPIEYLKKNNLKNALIYRKIDNNNFGKVIYGAFKTQKEALAVIKKLPKSLKKNKPYVSKIQQHQKKFKKEEKKVNESDTIFIYNTNDSLKLKEEFLNENSNYYSISVATLDLKKDSVKEFLKKNNIEDKALVHVFGKNRDKVRIIYGLYKKHKDALKAIKGFNYNLRKNKPYAMKMDKFQSFYRRTFAKKTNNHINKEVKIEKAKDEKKIVKKEEKKIKVTKEKKVEKIKKKTNLIKEKKEEQSKKAEPKKNITKKKIEPISVKLLEVKGLQDVYYNPIKGRVNPLIAVFLNDNNSPIYTIDLGELDLRQISIKEFYIKKGITGDTLSYKYGKRREYARVLYGAFESRKDANNAFNKLPFLKEDLRITNIENHQRLYKLYHKNFTLRKVAKVEKETKDEIFYTENGNKNLLKEEFFNKKSTKYTLTLMRIPKDDIDIRRYVLDNKLMNNILIYSIGSNNDYYKVFYKVFDSYEEAKKSLNSLNSRLKRNGPYISKIATNQKKFESYNNRKIKDYAKNTIKIEFR